MPCLLTTDDIFKSTLHRVINRSGMERYSIPLFFGTDYDVPLEVSDRDYNPLLLFLFDEEFQAHSHLCHSGIT